MSFSAFWSSYPRKVGKILAQKKYEQAIISGATHDEILNGVKEYVKYIVNNQIELRFIAHPSTYLTQGRWMDELEPNLPKQEHISSEESTRRAREKCFYERGVWKEEWGARPPPKEVRYLSAG